ncbi:sensor domain-containing protein [Glycomyces sp. TRM65418]|uniref:sensor histidine kinase n=1 Tax=Glycomyces sp. TRM65418 TaxID=2867006 RepID=UPI001CE5641D|nr:sensor histidine kinase [Glycomyces sp. TRM65418]MCC3763573.1 sensor domain-containing protein [Glycomyces sp. TRM65418]QZD57557.1 sensor domain-containing protein [Glycomyces sp. TRM65418]
MANDRSERWRARFEALVRVEREDTDLRSLLLAALRATGYGTIAAGFAILALYSIPILLLTGFLALLGVGRPLIAPMMQWVRIVAGLERRRLRRLGYEVPAPYTAPIADPPRTFGELKADPSARRDLAWIGLHATWGLILGALVLQMPIISVRDVTYPLWWAAAPTTERQILNGLIAADTQALANLGCATGVAVFALWLLFAPKLLDLQARPGVNLLGPDPEVDLSERVARLTATRAAALDAHAVELRRIERALHDGAQNRLVAVAVLIGAARREVTRAPERADEILERAQTTVEGALAELRAVVRSILPPVLEDRGLAGALSALASDCAVPCTVEVDVAHRCPASVEATAYFVVAESLTNVAKHSHASNASVEVRLKGHTLTVAVVDDGRGGADAASGSGLAGIARRVEALDGTATVTSPPGGPTEIRVELPCGS